MGSNSFQKGQNLHFSCINCTKDLSFSIFNLKQNNGLIHCPHCNQEYTFNDPKLIRHLQLFEALCLQVKESEEILSNASVGVNVGDHDVQIPYKLLLTRFNSALKLRLGNDDVTILFRLEPHSLQIQPEDSTCLQ